MPQLWVLTSHASSTLVSASTAMTGESMIPRVPPTGLSHPGQSENKDADVPFAETAFHADTHSSESAFGAVAKTSGDSLRVLDTDSLFLIDIVRV